ncbi:unnamed protein product [Rotaria sp. Silwood2]|nr:unnamed protein product [Rotaria sp. Silwood2]
MRVSRIYYLKDEITQLQKDYDFRTRQALDQFNQQKNHCKEILLTTIDELECIVNTSEIRNYLHDLSVMISNIIDNDPIFLLCRTNSIWQWILEILSVSTPDFVNNLSGGETFQEKLKELMKKIRRESSEVSERKDKNVSKLAEYFKTFIDKINNLQTHSTPRAIKIVWYDASVGNEENQSYVKRIQEKFPKNTFIQCINEDSLIQLIVSETAHEIILITSGKNGKSIIDKIGYYWNLQGVIIYCSNVNYHQIWTKPYKKITLVTNRFGDVLDEIDNILGGKSYFILKGFTYDDICLNLKVIHSPYYYLSSVATDGFVISSFSQVNLDTQYHKRIMQQLHKKIQEKNVFSGQVPIHFQLSNLESVAEHFIQAFDTKSLKPIEHQIIHFYSQSTPCFYKVVNDVLNLLDEELIVLIGDYIKTLRYALIIYTDDESKMKNKRTLELYRGIYLDQQSKENFLKKFKINDYIIFPSFLSTTMGKATALQFCQENGVLLKITIDTESSRGGNAPKCIKQISKFSEEEEVLFNCFSMLKVNNITEIKSNFYIYECSQETLG